MMRSTTASASTTAAPRPGPSTTAPNPYADFNGSGTLLERYVSGPGVVNGAVVDELLARTSSGGTTAWYLTDKLGSVRDIVSTSGTELDHIVYDSFGNIVTETNAANGDRFKFAGMEYDATTGQYYDRARSYDAVIGRFMSQDSEGFTAGDTDLYRYVGNNPADWTDPSGHQEPAPPPPAHYAGQDLPENVFAPAGGQPTGSQEPGPKAPSKYESIMAERRNTMPKIAYSINRAQQLLDQQRPITEEASRNLLLNSITAKN